MIALSGRIAVNPTGTYVQTCLALKFSRKRLYLKLNMYAPIILSTLVEVMPSSSEYYTPMKSKITSLKVTMVQLSYGPLMILYQYWIGP
jgi:hypothetical protein